jgi:hypothetical protein
MVFKRLTFSQFPFSALFTALTETLALLRQLLFNLFKIYFSFHKFELNIYTIVMNVSTISNIYLKIVDYLNFYGRY